MEQVCDPQNLVRAYRRVRSNKGKPGVDGMTVQALADWLRINHAALKSSLLDGTYQPQPVRGARGASPSLAHRLASSGKGWWRLSLARPVHQAMSKDWFAIQGLTSLVDKYDALQH